jgi:hypothetical protein
MFLSPEQMIALTGKTRGAYQIQALRKMGIHHITRPDGVPVVKEDWLPGVKSGANHRIEPDWDAMN